MSSLGAALIKVAQEEVRSAQTQFEQARESVERIGFKVKVLSGLSSISCIKGKIKRHNVLLDWIEQQRREIATSCADSDKEAGHGRPKKAISRASSRASLRAPRNRPATEASRTNEPPKSNGPKRKQSKMRSIISPFDPVKVSKAPGKRRSPRQKVSVQCGMSQAAEKTITDSSTPELKKSKQAVKVKDSVPTSLRPIHSSRVSKPGGRRPTKLHRDGTKPPLTTGEHRLKREHNLGRSLTPSTGRRGMRQSANAPLRRSTRTPKPPEKFCPGFT